MSVLETLLSDVSFMFQRTVASYNEDENEHLFFAVMYFYANRNLIEAVLDALFALPEAERKAHDPYPNDGAWRNSEKGAGYVVVSPVAWESYSAGVVKCPIEPDDINMLIRAIRIAVNALAMNASFKVIHRHLFMSPVEQFYNALRQSDAWHTIVPRKL
jgi:hypothetical protein